MTEETVLLKDLSFGNQSTGNTLNDQSAKSATASQEAYKDFIMEKKTVLLRDLSLGNQSPRDALNDHSVESATATLEAYAEYINVPLTKVDIRNLMKSLLCDLIHFCDRTEILFRDVIEDATDMYACEIEAGDKE